MRPTTTTPHPTTRRHPCRTDPSSRLSRGGIRPESDNTSRTSRPKKSFDGDDGDTGVRGPGSLTLPFCPNDLPFGIIDFLPSRMNLTFGNCLQSDPTRIILTILMCDKYDIPSLPAVNGSWLIERWWRNGDMNFLDFTKTPRWNSLPKSGTTLLGGKSLSGPLCLPFYRLPVCCGVGPLRDPAPDPYLGGRKGPYKGENPVRPLHDSVQVGSCPA